MVVGAAAGDCSAVGRVGGHGDGVGVELEVGDVFGVSGDGEGVACAVADHHVILFPIVEGVAGVGGGNEGAGITDAEFSVARNSASIGWIGAGRDSNCGCVTLCRGEVYRITPVGLHFITNALHTHAISSVRGQTSEGILGILNG